MPFDELKIQIGVLFFDRGQNALFDPIPVLVCHFPWHISRRDEHRQDIRATSRLGDVSSIFSAKTVRPAAHVNLIHNPVGTSTHI